MDLKKLPTEVSRHLRRHTWIPRDSPSIFHMARDIAHHRQRRFDVTDLVKVLAYAVHKDMALRSDLGEEALELRRQLTLVCPNQDLGPVGREAIAIARSEGEYFANAAHMRAACQARMERDVQERIAQHGDPYSTIREAVAAAAKEHPRLGLTSGYIGNVWIGPIHDDRSWMVFTKLATPSCRGGCDVHFGGVPTHHIEDLAAMMGEPFQAWLAKCEQNLDAGLVRIVGDEREAA